MKRKRLVYTKGCGICPDNFMVLCLFKLNLVFVFFGKQISWRPAFILLVSTYPAYQDKMWQTSGSQSTIFCCY